MSAKEIRKLEAVIIKLESWQVRNSQHDPDGLANAAKERLMRLLRNVSRNTAA